MLMRIKGILILSAFWRTFFVMETRFSTSSPFYGDPTMKRSATLLLSFIVFAASLTLYLSRTFGVRHVKDPDERSGALQALDFWTRSRAYPESDIPSSAYYRAFQSARM